MSMPMASCQESGGPRFRGEVRGENLGNTRPRVGSIRQRNEPRVVTVELSSGTQRSRSPLHTTRGLDPSQQRGGETRAIIQDRKGMRDWISSLLRISKACPRNTQKGSPPGTHCHIDPIHGHNPRRIDAVRNGPHFQRSGGYAVTQSSNIDELAWTPVCSEASLL